MLLDIARYLDHVIKTANPKKLIFIAIDGVAPQAKINQQRACVDLTCRSSSVYKA